MTWGGHATRKVLQHGRVTDACHTCQGFVAFILLLAVDTMWLTVLVVARLRSNEGDMRRHARYYAFWREQHALRMAPRRTAWGRYWLQLKAQHKMLRVFYQRYEAATRTVVLAGTGSYQRR